MLSMRVLGRIRLSRLTEESTSVDRQRELIQNWADANEHTVVGWAEDIDISGGIDPFDTPALGPWLKEPKRDDWDILCTWKLDRLSRNARHLGHLCDWCEDNQKTVVSCSEGDLSTPVGRLLVSVIGFLAQGELEAIKERTKAGRKKVVESGRWPGGPAPFGFEKVKLDGGGFKLKTRADQVLVIKRIRDDILSGLSMEAVAKLLNEDKVPSAQRTAWRSSVLFVMMESKLLLGHSTYKGETVRDAQGMPVMVSDPVFTQDEWDRLQAAIAARRLPSARKRTQSTSPLYGVIFCFECGSMLYHRKYKGEYKYEYYQCPKSCGRMIHAAQINSYLEKLFLSEVGGGKIKERVYVPAESHEAELAVAQRGVDEISAMFGAMTSDTVRRRLTEQLTALDAQIKRLEAMPSRESHYDYVETGETYAQAWEAADKTGKRELLVKSGITLAAVKRRTTSEVTLKLTIPKGLADQMGLKSPQSGSLTELFSDGDIQGIEFDRRGRYVDTAMVHAAGGEQVEVHILTDEGEAQAAEFYGWNSDSVE